MRRPYFAIQIYFVVFAAFLMGYLVLIRPWYMNWGATDAEIAMVLPGDTYIPPATHVSTRAVTIHATPAAIWPWIVQLGQGRGGFYSYDWLENLFAADMQNADAIEPEWQHLALGDHVSFQRNGPYTKVAYFEPDKVLVVEGGWTWYLQPVDAHHTRLIVRYASFPINNVLASGFYYAIFEPVHFVMEHGMMLGIRARAEALIPDECTLPVYACSWQEQHE